MDPQNVGNQNDYSDKPHPLPNYPEGKRFPVPRKFLVLVGAAVIVLVISLLYLYFSGGKSTDELNKHISKEELERLRAEDKSDEFEYMGEKVSAWLQKQRSPSGIYYFAQSCTTADECEAPVLDNRAGVYTIWGQSRYLSKIGASGQLLNSIIQDINAYSDESVVNVIQQDHWNCKLMYEVWQNSAFNTEQKEKIKTICTRAQIPPLSSFERADTIKVEDLVNQINTFETISSEGQKNAKNFVPFVTAVSEYTTLYEWVGRVQLRNIAYAYFEEVMEIYGANKENLKQDLPLLGVASVDLYKVTDNKKFLDFAENIFEKSADYECEQLSTCVNTVFLADELYELTKNEKYSQYAFFAVRKNSQQHFDYAGFNETFGFGAYYYDYANKFYPVMENSFLLGQLSKVR